MKFHHAIPVSADYVIHRLGQNVRRIRMEAGLTQELLAERCSKFKAQIPHIEDGTVTSNLAMLLTLAEALEVEPSVLLLPTPLRSASPPTPARPQSGPEPQNLPI